MVVSKPAIVFHAAEVFFSFLALCCFASVAAFQAKWGVGPCTCISLVDCQISWWLIHILPLLAGLTGFALFIAIFGMLLPLFMLLVPVIHEKYDKFLSLARAMQEVRVGFILAGSGLAFTFLIRYIPFSIP
jgi:hypothetical protein